MKRSNKVIAVVSAAMMAAGLLAGCGSEILQAQVREMRRAALPTVREAVFTI